MHTSADPAVAFFREHAGYSYDPLTETADEGREKCAAIMAAAEAWARDAGYSFDWRIDDDIDSRDFSDAQPPYRLWMCGMFDADGIMVRALGGVDFGRDGEPWGNPYRRVCEADLAVEQRAECEGPDDPAWDIESTDEEHERNNAALEG